MELTKNEKRTLKLLLGNARITDSEIASKLNISSQAVGKIRRKLEGFVVDSYGINLNFALLGVQTFALALSRLTPEGIEKGHQFVEAVLCSNPHIISAYRISGSSTSHILLYGFKNMNELDDFFHSNRMHQNLHRFIETQKLYTFSHSGLIKNDSAQLFHKIVDSSNTKFGSISGQG